jgi:hypothetical protein
VTVRTEAPALEAASASNTQAQKQARSNRVAVTGSTIAVRFVPDRPYRSPGEPV